MGGPRGEGDLKVTGWKAVEVTTTHSLTEEAGSAVASAPLPQPFLQVWCRFPFSRREKTLKSSLGKG